MGPVSSQRPCPPSGTRGRGTKKPEPRGVATLRSADTASTESGALPAVGRGTRDPGRANSQ